MSNKALQRLYRKQYSASFLERLFFTPFDFSRSILPAHNNTGFIHSIFHRLENHYLIDIVLTDADGSEISFKHNNKEKLIQSAPYKTLQQAEALKRDGKRVFFVTLHEGYVGPYALRSLLRRIGFESLGAHCNTVIGPRMRSNFVLRMISSNAGNTFLILPSSKTKAIAHSDLAEALIKNSKRTQALIKMPNAALSLLDSHSLESFKALAESAEQAKAEMDDFEYSGWEKFLSNPAHREAILSLEPKDFDLFKKLKYEPFMVFPEGTRSLINQDGSITLRYINPRYVQAYMRPGDYVLPVSVVGGNEALRGIRLSHAKFGLNTGEIFQVDQNMIDNYETTGIDIMKKVAALPNIKRVYFDDKVQNKKTKLKMTRKSNEAA